MVSVSGRRVGLSDSPCAYPGCGRPWRDGAIHRVDELDPDRKFASINSDGTFDNTIKGFVVLAHDYVEETPDLPGVSWL